eukprot:gene8153-8994_t
MLKSTELSPNNSRTSSARANMMNSGEFNTMLRQTSSAVWTINDQQRLLALDGLHDRMLAFHNNIHVKESKIDRSPSMTNLGSSASGDATQNLLGGMGANRNVTLAQAIRFSPQGDESPFPLSYSQLLTLVRQVNNNNNNNEDNTNNQGSFLWIHLHDSSVIESIACDLGIHDLIVAGFQDYRAHSNMLPGNGEMLLTLVTSVLEENDCNMYKLFIYVSSSVIITFQAELLPDVSTPTIPNPELIVGSLLKNYVKLREKCTVLGPFYLVYELALKVLRMSDSSLEFISCALSYFNRVVHLNLLHRERLDLRIKMDMIASGVLLMKRTVDEVKSLCSTLLQLAMDLDNAPLPIMTSSNGNSAKSLSGDQVSPGYATMDQTESNVSFSNSVLHNNKRFQPNAANYLKKYTRYNLNNVDYNASVSQSAMRKMLYGDWLAIRHIPYLLDLCDAYTFIHTCLHTEFEETVRLQAELDGTIQLRTSNTSLVLSLIATIFLPLTFLAGVFGMNFQENGGYTIGMLNYKYGPLVFSMMCTFCFIIIFSFFIYQGWIELGIFAKIFRNIHRTTNQQIDDSEKDTTNTRAARRASVEEARRKEESTLLRKTMVVSARASSRPFANTGHGAGNVNSPLQQINESFED